MFSRFSTFAAGVAGSAAIEFALLGSIFCVLMLGQFEIGYMLYLQHSLDDATVVASRSIQVGVAQRAQDDTVDKFKTNRLCPALGSLLDCSKVIVDSGLLPNAGSSFDSGTWANTPIGSRSADTFCLGSSGEYMFLRISYPQPPITGGLLPASMFTLYNGQKVTMLQSFAVIRIEPVQAKRTGPCK